MMDSWKYLSEGKGVWLSEELDFPFDGHGSCKNKVVGSEIKPFFNVENYPLVSNAQAFERLDLMELGLSDEIRKSYSLSSEPSGEVFSNEIGGTDSCGNVVSPFCEEKDSGPRISSDFSLIDLKLGRLVDGGGGKDDFSRASVPASSNVSSPPVRRARSTTSHPRTPCCQVFGCNKDLSSYKGYYKRHKVCDVHTKTAKVIIEGMEQRFCQQCSRFHLLAEFDDGKRSCRRRLAAHNKRRRKPQHASKPGSRIIGFSSSFAFPDMLPSAGIDSGEGMVNMMTGMKDNMLDLERFSGIQQNSSALSLLSAESHNMSNQLLGAAITSPLINKSSHTDSSLHSANNSEKIAQSGFHTPGMYSVGANHVKPTIINHCDGNTVDLKLPDDGMSMGPYLRNDTNYHNNPLGRGIILDLLQLSSRLQRIEHQKHPTESEAG